jgi:hypothetical protein
MSTGAIVAILVAVALVILVIGSMTVMRRRQFRRRFGPEAALPWAGPRAL